MAGHSHWANIQHKKGAADAKRGKLFSKLSRAIIVAARNGGGDPDMNLKLRYAIDKARQASMPKDNIERAINKGTGELDGTNYEEVVYEGYGPGGVAVMVEIFTDNRNRTSGEVRKIFDKSNGNLGTSGCVAYLFERKGFFSIDSKLVDEETLMEIGLESGADDVKLTDGNFEIVCDPSTFDNVDQALKTKAIKCNVSEITYLPSMQVDTDVETGMKVMRLMDALDENDDVQNVYSNLNITEELMAEASKE